MKLPKYEDPDVFFCKKWKDNPEGRWSWSHTRWRSDFSEFRIHRLHAHTTGSHSPASPKPTAGIIPTKVHPQESKPSVTQSTGVSTFPCFREQMWSSSCWLGVPFYRSSPNIYMPGPFPLTLAFANSVYPVFEGGRPKEGPPSRVLSRAFRGFSKCNRTGRPSFSSSPRLMWQKTAYRNKTNIKSFGFAFHNCCQHWVSRHGRQCKERKKKKAPLMKIETGQRGWFLGSGFGRIVKEKSLLAFPSERLAELSRACLCILSLLGFRKGKVSSGAQMKTHSEGLFVTLGH